MTLLGSKKGYSKNDINFFDEFTASAKKQTQILGVIVFIGIIAIGIALAVLGYYFVINSGVKKDIDGLNTRLASDEYAGLELRSQALQQEINDKNQYYFTLTEMRRVADETNAASTDIVNLIAECIPSDAYVTEYEVTGNTMSVAGMTFSYYDAANIAYLLNRSDIFAGAVVPTIEQDNSMRDSEEVADNPIDVYYDFVVAGNLVNDCVISLVHYANTETSVIALSGVSTQTVANGSEFEFTGIDNFEVSGVNYTLVSISVNDIPMSDEELALVQSADRISGIADGNYEIALYYTPADAVETEAVEEGV